MANGKITNILEIYDPRQDIWEQGSPLPRNISSYALAAVEGKLFVFGGWDGTSVFDSVFIYDPALDSWHEGSSMRLPAYDLGAVALTEQIVIMGGRNADGALKTVWAYYPSRDFNGEEAWVEFMDFPESRFGFSTAGVYDAIYVLGGWIGQEDAVDERGLMMTNEEWIKFPANQTYYDRQPAMVSLGALLYILDPSPDLDETRLWTYQAFYYSIFIPYMP